MWFYYFCFTRDWSLLNSVTCLLKLLLNLPKTLSLEFFRCLVISNGLNKSLTSIPKFKIIIQFFPAFLCFRSNFEDWLFNPKPIPYQNYSVIRICKPNKIFCLNWKNIHKAN